MASARTAPRMSVLSSTLLSRLSLLTLPLLLLLLPSEIRGQIIRARGFQLGGPSNMVAIGSLAETLSVTSAGACAMRAIYHNWLGFNLKRETDADGKRTCEIVNTITGCLSVNMEARDGWDYYLVGRRGQNEVVNYRSTGYTISSRLSVPSDYPPLLTTEAENPDYRWGIDCNNPATVRERQCSRYLLTGLYHGASRMDQVDYVRCFMYGHDFRVSQEVAAAVPVPLEPGITERTCPPQHVVTAIHDTEHSDFTTLDLVKCNLLLANWRVNYADCYTQDPRGSGGGSNSWSYNNWNIGTPQLQPYGVVGIWRDGPLFTGFRACRLYRIA